MLKLFDNHFQMDEVIIGPGEHYTSSDGILVCTSLGSCVAVCLKDIKAGIAGMNHFMLPEPLDSSNVFASDAGRFGIFAMELLINEMISRGASRPTLVAKVFGGANVLPCASPSGQRISQSNVMFAFRFLEMERIPMKANDTGGQQGRKVFFFG